MSRLLCIGMGYAARVLGDRARRGGWHVHGTSRSEEGAARLRAAGFDASVMTGDAASTETLAAVALATHIVVSPAPDVRGDPVLRAGADAIASSPAEWIGYLSTVGVYGNHQGAWVDEDTPVRPISPRSLRRAEAENAWLDFGRRTGKAVHIFRLAGIYGPGRSAIDNLRTGSARRIDKRHARGTWRRLRQHRARHQAAAKRHQAAAKRHQAAAKRHQAAAKRHPQAATGVHSITSLARSLRLYGMVKPSALAVFRLMSSSNLVGCSIGRSDGFAPLSILST